jgi:hypothetical protein
VLMIKHVFASRTCRNSMVCDVAYKKRLANDSSLPPYRPGLYYDWKSDPPLNPWDLTAFCKNIHGKKILIVGDSLNFQLYESMVNVGPFPLAWPGKTVPAPSYRINTAADLCAPHSTALPPPQGTSGRGPSSPESGCCAQAPLLTELSCRTCAM